MQTSTTFLRQALRLTAIVLLLAGSATVAKAQVLVRMNRASATVKASVSVPVMLRVTPAREARVVARTEQFVEVEVPVSVRANLEWTLRVSATEADDLELLDDSGTWVSLTPGRAAFAIRGQQPTNAEEHRLRVRVRPEASASVATRLRLQMEPGAG